MRVLLVNTSERIGGAAIACNRLMSALKNHGIRAKMMVRDKQTDQLSVISIAQNWRLPLKFLWERVVIFFNNGFSRKNLFQIDIANVGTDITSYREFEQADVIHLHWTNQAYLSLNDIDKILHSGKRIVITMHDMWYFTGVCHYSGECNKYQSQCESCKLLKGGIKDLAKEVFIRKKGIYSNADITFVGCSSWIAELAKKSLLTQGHNIVNIPNAIDTTVFKPLDRTECRKSQGLPMDKRLLLFGSQRITDERKGFRFLLDACNIIKETNPQVASEIGIVVVGSDSDKVANLVPFPVYPISYVSNEKQMAELYNSVDFYVTPSLQDNLPNTIVESMSCGLPCVGFNVGGIPEMIDHKENGYVANYMDADDFAQGILWLINADYAQISKAAKMKALNTYSEESVASKYMQIYTAK